MRSVPIAIVGGGISGLAAAFYLQQQGLESIVIERQARWGGLIKTDFVEGCRLEAGPDSFLAAKPATGELARELGALANELIPSNDARRRIYIERRGRLLPMPAGMVMMVPGRLLPALRSPLFSWRTKARLINEWRATPRDRTDDVSVGELVREHFGTEMLDTIAEPLLTGVYGGDPSNLSAASVLPRFAGYEQRYGSLRKGVQQETSAAKSGGSAALFQSFRDGMQSLTDALAIALPGRARVDGVAVTCVTRRGKKWRLESTGRDAMEADNLVLAVPAHQGAELLAEVAPGLSAALGVIPYSSAMLVTFVYRDSELRHPLDGFGFLVPRSERRTLAAVTWIHRKFPQRVPAGLAAMRGFIVGEDALRLAASSDEELARLARADIERGTGISAAPLRTIVHRWPQSMPQYTVGHAQRVEAIRRELSETSRLYLAGNFCDGVGISDCVRGAKEVAARVAAAVAASG